MPHYLYCRHRFPRWRAMSIGKFGFFKTSLGRCASPQPVARRGSARCPPRSARGPSRRRHRRRRERRRWRAGPPDRSVRDAERVQYVSDSLHVGVREKRPRSRGRVRTPRVRGTARPRHTRRDEARGIERTRAVACASRGVGDRNGPSRAASIVPPRRARTRETKQTKQTQQTPRRIRRTKRAGSRAYRSLPLCSRGERSATSRKACLTRRVIRA